MNRTPSDFTLIKGKVIHQNDDDDLPVIGKFPDYVRVYLWLVLYPDGLLASWDSSYIDDAISDLIERGVYHEAFSHVFFMRFDHFKQKFPNVFIPDKDFQPEFKYTFKKH